jgi:hypothetical protein
VAATLSDWGNNPANAAMPVAHTATNAIAPTTTIALLYVGFECTEFAKSRIMTVSWWRSYHLQLACRQRSETADAPGKPAGKATNEQSGPAAAARCWNRSNTARCCCAKNQHHRCLCSVNGPRVGTATTAGEDVAKNRFAVFRMSVVE